jgi:hypothetical protein
VSYTNELAQDEALGFMRQWLEANPKYVDIAAAFPVPQQGLQVCDGLTPIVVVIAAHYL